MSIRKLGFILSCMVLMVAIAACGGNGNDKYWTCGSSSQCRMVEASSESAPDITGPIIFDTSVTMSQAVRLSNWLFERRKEVGNPGTSPKFLQIQDGRFVIHQYVGPPESEALTPEQQARIEKFMCEMSNEVFGGVSVTGVGHIFESSTYTFKELANYALSAEQQSPLWAGSCGSGVAKKSETKPASEKAESSKSTVSWTKETLYAKFLVPDDFPDGWTVKRDAETLTIRGTHTEFMTVQKIDMDFEIHDTALAANQSFDQRKADTQSTIDGRGISGDRLEDVKHDEPLFVWMLKGNKDYGSDSYESFGLTGNVVFRVYNYGSVRTPSKGFASMFARRQMDKLTD